MRGNGRLYGSGDSAQVCIDGRMSQRRNDHVFTKAVSFGEILSEDFKAYGQQIISNAQAMAKSFVARGYNLISGGTDNHLMLIDLRNKDLTGKKAQETMLRDNPALPEPAKIQRAIRALNVIRQPRKQVIDRELHKDIMKLKRLKVIPDRRQEYLEYKRIVRRRYGLAETTIDNEIRKDMPGYYRANSRCSRMLPITEQEKRMVEELFAISMQQQEMMRIMSNHLGIAYGKKRLNKVRDLIARNPSPPGAPSAFDANLKTLFYGFCKLDLSDPNARLEDVSVGHGDEAVAFREANRVAALNREGKATTEDLRRAIKDYGTVFESLLDEGARA